MNICLIYPRKGEFSETFIVNQERWLRGRTHVDVVWGDAFPCYLEDGSSLDPPPAWWERPVRSYMRRVKRVPWDYFRCRALERYLSSRQSDVVIAEFAPVGVEVLPVCRTLGVPLVVYFRGADAAAKSIVEYYGPLYADMIRESAAVVTVSEDLRKLVIDLYDANPGKVHTIPSGVDTKRFKSSSDPVKDLRFLFVGRFVDKKSPFLTLQAFKTIRESCPDARLIMIGDGVLKESVRQMATAWGVERDVTFAGVLAPDEIVGQLQGATALLHHAVTTGDGDREGTPNSVVEAQACGIPVIATRHGGIPEVIVDGETGFLVDEYDVSGMAQYGITLARDRALVARMGAAARQRIETTCDLDVCMSKLWSILRDVTGTAP